MTKRLGVQVGFGAAGKEREDLIRRVQIAEDVGVEAAFVAEAWGRDAFTFLTELALKTKRIKLGTAIVNVFSRTPAVLAMTFASLDELSGNRMIIGLGSSGANVIEHWHGVPFEKPLRRIREYVDIINMIMRGERLVYHGQIFNLERGFRLGAGGPENFGPQREHIPIYIAAITPKSIVQTGEIADGWIPIYWPLGRFAEGIAQLEEGAKKAGRSVKDIDVSPSITVSIARTPDEIARARNAARAPVAFYIGRMGTFYYEMLIRNGFEAEVAACRAAWAERDQGKAIAAISDRMLDETAIVGTLDECAEKLAQRYAAGVTMPIINLPVGETPEDTGRMLERLLR